MRTLRGMSLLSLLALMAISRQGAGQEEAAATADEKLIANATSAAPPPVASDATVVAPDEKGAMRTLRKGGGSFTCMPDNPDSPGNDPMCLDANAMAWAQAWMGRTEPPPGKVGFGYMLQGGSDASNTDPHAMKPAAGTNWVDTGPHVMVFSAPSLLEGYPTQADDPDTRKPYVMWAGTPYAHLMIPVQ